MISISGKTTSKNTDQIKKFIAEMKKHQHGAYVTIGVHQDAGAYTSGKNNPDVVQVALWNEFGTENIPARSFMRSAVDENIGLINKWRKDMLQDIANGTRTVPQALEAIGFRIQNLVQNKIKSNIEPENAPSTARKKEKEGVAVETLLESTLLLRSITYKVTA